MSEVTHWFDWIHDIDWPTFFAWPRDASIWNVLNSPVLVTFLAAIIGVQLNRRVTKAEEKAEDAANLVTLKDEVEATEIEEEHESETETSATAPTSPSADFRNEAEAVFDQAEVYIKGLMDKADGRHRRTYRNIAGASLPIKAAALLERKGLERSQYEGAVELAHEWNQYRRGKAARKLVPRSALDKMRRSLSKLRNR